MAYHFVKVFSYFFEFTFIYKNDTDKFISANPINLSIASKTLLHAFRRTVDQLITCVMPQCIIHTF